MNAIPAATSRLHPITLSQFKTFVQVAGLVLVASSFYVPTFADDTEVFFAPVDPSLSTQPNVMLVMDTSSAMNRSDGTSSTRLERLKESLNSLIDTSNNVNMGLMRFNGSGAGGAVLFPVTDLDKTFCTGGACGDLLVTSQIKDDLNDVSETLSTHLIETSSAWLSLGQNSLSEAQSTGLVFDNLAIPQGARIVQAHVEFTAYQNSTGVASFAISAQQLDNAPSFSGVAGEVSSATYGSSTSWSPGNWSKDVAYESPDISTELQAIVNRTGWCGGNSIALNFEGSGQRDAISSQLSTANAPRLVLSYDIGSIPASGGCTKAVLVSSVATSLDDAEQVLTSNNVDVNDHNLDLPTASKEQMIGLRFDQLNLPQGAIINNAYIEFQIGEFKTGDVTLYVKGQAADNAIQFSGSKYDVSNRTPTASSASWVNPLVLPIGSTLQSPDVKSVVQEIVNRSGWAQGNAMVFLMGKTSGTGRRVVHANDYPGSSAPKLTVDYTVPSGTASATGTTITTRDKLKEIVADITYTAGAPVVDAYYEAAQYYLSGQVDHGKIRGTPSKAANRVSHPDSWDSNTGNVVRDPLCSDANLGSIDCKSEYIAGSPQYISPMTSSCQTSNIVLLSTGGVASNVSASKIRTLIDQPVCDEDSGSEACGRSLSTWLYGNDNSGTLPGKQFIQTYSVGFNLGSTSSSVAFLRDVANNGGGSFHEASSASELTTVFETIIGEVLDIDTSFVAPGATVNQFNRLTHRNDIYFAVFKPDGSPTWSGNLKRYEVGMVSGDTVGYLDVNGDPAVDAGSGYFSETSESWWSGLTDGNAVELGGAAGRMVFDGSNGPATRRAFTYTGSGAVPSAGVDLTLADHELNKTNSKITLDMLGLTGMSGTALEIAAYREKVLDWARGIDVMDIDEDGDTTDWRAKMGDPMHSKPLVVNYGTIATTQSTIFVATNEGFLHAIDSDSGDELYSFMPQELLPNLGVFMENNATTKHPYGLDGSISLWTDDANNDVIVNAGESATLYVGMRRGGQNYYAIDVSDRLNPELKWIIKGGAGGTVGFEELGQSWSRMVPAKITFSGAQRDVLVFAGGYDTNQDAAASATTHVRTTDGIGRGIFIVDADTGALLWSGLGTIGGSQFFSAMQYSIPSDIRVIDIDADGLADQFYVGDMGGQVWRFDVIDEHSTGNLMTGGVIADLSDSGSANERRFYYEPDVSLVGKDGERFLSISIGSGWRAHPLDRVVEDRFYMLRSSDIYGPPSGGNYGKPHPVIIGTTVPVTEYDLLNITGDIEPDTNSYGWYLDLAGAGEKVLGHSITINNQIIFASYKPDLSTGDCAIAVGGGAAYVLNVLDGSPTMDFDEDGDIDEDDRHNDLTHGGIPPEAVALITEFGNIVAVQTEILEVDFNNLTQRTFWMDLGPDGESSEAISELESN